MIFSLLVRVAIARGAFPAASAGSAPSEMSVRRGGLYGEYSTAAIEDLKGRPPGTKIALERVILIAILVLAMNFAASWPMRMAAVPVTCKKSLTFNLTGFRVSCTYIEYVGSLEVGYRNAYLGIDLEIS